MKASDDQSSLDSHGGGSDLPRTGISPAESEAIARIQEWLDRDGLMDSPPPAPAEPVSHGWWTAAQALQDGLRLAVRPTIPAEWPGVLLQSVLADRRQRTRRRLGYGIGAVLAASLLCAVTVIALRGERTKPTTEPDPGADVAGQVPRPTPPAANLHDSLVEARAAVVTLTKRTADETVDRTFSFLTVPEGRMLAAADPWEKTLDPAAESLGEARNGAAAGLEPVTTSARRAVDRFFREINPMGQSRPEPY